MNKKGLSTVIITLILILLSIVSVGIVWVVVANVLKGGEEQTSSALGGLFLNLKIENVNVESNGDVKVTVKRNAGEGEISGINFIVSDGENSQVVKKDESISELATKTFTITSSDLGDVAFVKTIEIAPVFESGGKEQIGNVVDKWDSGWELIKEIEGEITAGSLIHNLDGKEYNKIMIVDVNSESSWITPYGDSRWDWGGFNIGVNVLKLSGDWYYSSTSPARGCTGTITFKTIDNSKYDILENSQICYFGGTNNPSYCANRVIIDIPNNLALESISDIESASGACMGDNGFNVHYFVYGR